jgi:hypothetical protein
VFALYAMSRTGGASGHRQVRHLDLAMEIAPRAFRPRMPQRHQCASLILALAHLLDGNPVLACGRNIKLLGRFLDGFPLGGGFDSPEVFGALADYIDAPTGHFIDSRVWCSAWNNASSW